MILLGWCALSGEVFDQDGVSRAEPPGGAIADYDLHLSSGKENSLLAARRIVPIAEMAVWRMRDGDHIVAPIIQAHNRQHTSGIRGHAGGVALGSRNATHRKVFLSETDVPKVIIRSTAIPTQS
jgi:hypothetical protein